MQMSSKGEDATKYCKEIAVPHVLDPGVPSLGVAHCKLFAKLPWQDKLVVIDCFSFMNPIGINK